MRHAQFALLLAGVLWPSTAPAQPRAPASNTEAPERRWYGWQTLLADVPSLAVIGIGAAFNGTSSCSGGERRCGDTTTVALAGVAANVLGAPVVHFAHGHIGKGLGDAGMRLGINAIAGLLYVSCTIHEAKAGCLTPLAIGFSLNAILDATIFASENGPPSKSSKNPAASFIPLASTNGRQTTLGVAGHF